MSAHVEVEGLDRVLARIPSPKKVEIVKKRLLGRIGLAYERALKEAYQEAGIHNRTGAGIGSLGIEPDPDGEGIRVGDVKADAGYPAHGGVRYLRFLDEGTGIYGPKGQPIKPKVATFMRWASGGVGELRATGSPRAGVEASFVFARQTKGMKARPFFKKGTEKGRIEAHELIMEAGRELTRLGV